jgi:hypothetical protein
MWLIKYHILFHNGSKQRRAVNLSTANRVYKEEHYNFTKKEGGQNEIFAITKLDFGHFDRHIMFVCQLLHFRKHR